VRAARLAERCGGDCVRVWDDSSAAREDPPPGIPLARASEGALDGVRTVVKSPGVRLDHRLIAQARRRGLPVIDELELGWRLTPHPTIAVTGTNGKSTTAALIATALRSAGHGAALAGNVEAVQGGGPLCTLPCEHAGWVVTEVSSYQAVGLDRMLADIAVFTNLTPDHLHWHGSMSAYGQAKRRVFIDGSRCARIAVVNVDDPFGAKLAREVRALGGDVLAYGWASHARYRVEACEWDASASRISLSTPSGELRLRTLLPGAHNAANVAAAIATADAIGLSRERTLPAIAAMQAPPGRLERIDGADGFEVFVDFAHSMDSIERVLARELLLNPDECEHEGRRAAPALVV
jgi:UDP-N-acetylmuramoylalanine-D-glutamate ligase